MPGKTSRKKNSKNHKRTRKNDRNPKFWKKLKKSKKQKKIYHEGDCTYYIVQHGEGYSEDNDNLNIFNNFNNIYPVIMENFEIIRCVPPMWVMMSNEMVNKNFRKLLNNGMGKNFWQIWNRQFSRNRDAQPKQTQASNDDNIGVVQMNQMPLLAKIMQVFEHGNRYYNEMLKHDVDGDFGIWRKCERSNKWTCIFNNKTIDKLFHNNKNIYNLLYNQNGEIKPYSIRDLITVLLNRERIGYKTNLTRFIFASCSPLQTFDRRMPITKVGDILKRYSDNSSYDIEYWYRKLVNLQYRIFIFIKGNEMFIKKVGTYGSINNTLEYKHYDLGEVIAIAENDERRDIYIQFNAFFTWLRTWEQEGKLFDFPMYGGTQRFTARDSIKYILYYLKRNIYNGGVSPNIRNTKNMDPNSSRIYNRLKENHGKENHENDFPEIFQEIENDYAINKAMQTSNTSSNQTSDESERYFDTSLQSRNNSSEQDMMFSPQ